MDAQKEPAKEDLQKTLEGLRDALKAYIKAVKELKKVHEKTIKELLKRDPTGFTVVYAFLYGYCANGSLRSKDSRVECKEVGLQEHTTDIGVMYTAKFEAIIPPKEIELFFNDLCPTSRGDACLEILAPTKEDESGTKIEGGIVALIPLGVLKRVEVRCKDKVVLELKEDEFERYEWKRIPLKVKIGDVERIEFEVKQLTSFISHERIGSGSHKKEYKIEIGTALETKIV